MSKLTTDCFYAMKQMTLIEKTQYLNRLIEDKSVLDFEDIGFCYWHISDNFALLRDSKSLFSNHRVFWEHISTGESGYLFWSVSDATQRLTLEIGGYSEFWWELYSAAVKENVSGEYQFAEFCSHRAALYVNPQLSHSEDNLLFAISNFENLLKKTEYAHNYRFYKLVYLSLLSRFTTIDHAELLALAVSFLGGLYTENCDERIPGEWKSFQTPFCDYKQSVIGLNSAINAFLYCREEDKARELYSSALNFGMAKNSYIEERLRK